MKAGENPFRTECLERVRFRLPADTNWNGLLARLRALNYRAAITGPHGSGKTMFLDRFAPHLVAQGFRLRRVKLDEETRRLDPHEESELLAGLEARDLVILDGAEQLNPLRWWRFQRRVRSAGGLLITTHHAGRLPTLIEFQPTAALLKELLQELCPDRQLSVDLDPAALFTAQGGNLRHALLASYDICAVRQA